MTLKFWTMIFHLSFLLFVKNASLSNFNKVATEMEYWSSDSECEIYLPVAEMATSQVTRKEIDFSTPKSSNTLNTTSPFKKLKNDDLVLSSDESEVDVSDKTFAQNGSVQEVEIQQQLVQVQVDSKNVEGDGSEILEKYSNVNFSTSDSEDDELMDHSSLYVSNYSKSSEIVTPKSATSTAMSPDKHDSVEIVENEECDDSSYSLVSIADNVKSVEQPVVVVKLDADAIEVDIDSALGASEVDIHCDLNTDENPASSNLIFDSQFDHPSLEPDNQLEEGTSYAYGRRYERFDENSINLSFLEDNSSRISGSPQIRPSSPSMSEFVHDNSDSEDNFEKMICSDEESRIQPYFRHVAGIRNSALNCYASAIISCLYSNPVFHEAVFEEANDLIADPYVTKYNSIPMSFAAIFQKLRFNVSPVDLRMFFFSAVDNTFEWEFGDTECVIEFWNRLWSTFPSKLKSLFEIEIQETHHRRSDDAVITSRVVKDGIIMVSPGSGFVKISSFIVHDFRDVHAESFIVKSSEKEVYSHILSEIELSNESDEDISIPAVTTSHIINTPEILTFGVRRLLWNRETEEYEYNFEPLEFSETIMVNGVSYTNLASVEFDEDREHYFANVQDFLNRNWYTHDDEKVFLVPDTEEEINDLSERLYTKATLFFFIKTDTLKTFDAIPLPEISEDLGRRFRVKPAVTERVRASSRKRKVKAFIDDYWMEFDDEAEAEAAKAKSKEKRKRLRPNNGPNNVDLGIETVTEEASKTTKDQQRELKSPEIPQTSPQKKRKRIKAVIDLHSPKEISQISGPSLTIKRHTSPRNNPKISSSRSKVPPVFVDDIYLGIRAFGFKSSPETQVFEHILFILAKTPSVVRTLFDHIQSDSNVRDARFLIAEVLVKMLTGETSIDISELKDELQTKLGVNFAGSIREIWNEIVCKILPSEICPISNVKTIEYDQDEPMAFNYFTQDDVESEFVAQKSCECPRNLGINGIFFDEIVDLEENKFIRKIIRPNGGLILPAHINRISGGTFHSSIIDIGFDYAAPKASCHSAICGIPECPSILISVFREDPNAKTYTLFWNGQAKLFLNIDDDLYYLLKRVVHSYSYFYSYIPVERLNDPGISVSDIPEILKKR